MDRSIDAFVRRQKAEQAVRKQQSRRLTPIGSARGLDAFYETLQNYYQEADEENANEEEGMDTDTDEDGNDPLDADIDTLDAGLDEANKEQASYDDAENPTEGDTDTSFDEPMDMDNKAPVETDGINGTLPEEDPSNEQDPMATFGQHGGDDLPNNQYDPQEIARVMEFVADEAKSLSDYVEAAKTSKVDILQRLYSDIADEERYHMEQLLFAKAEITGEEYKPRDPDIRKEYEELISMGMDEGSAMATAVDKFNLRSVTVAKTDPSGNVQEITHQEMQEAFEEIDRGIMYMEMVQFVMRYDTDDYILEGLADIANQNQVYQEELDYANQKTYSKKLSPFRLIAGAIVGIIKLIKKICAWLSQNREKQAHRIHSLIKFMKHHGGIKALFQSGVQLYLWNDKTNTMDINGICDAINYTYWLTQDVVIIAGLQNGQAGRVFANGQQPRFKTPNSAKKPSTMSCYRALQALNLFKTKCIVNDNNAGSVAAIMFTTYDNDAQQLAKEGKGIIDQAKMSGQLDLTGSFHNVYCMLDVILQILEYYTELTKNVAGELESLENDDQSIYRKDINKYNNCIEYLNMVTKSLSKITKVCTSDLETLNGLMDQVGRVENQGQQQPEQ